MKTFTCLAVLAASVSTVAASVPQGFNYGSTFTDGSAKQLQDFVNEFNTAQKLVGAPGSGFTSARLYTMVQAGTANSPISAIPAAISTKTHVLLGMWASAGDAAFANELAALKSTISQFGPELLGLVDGLSVGSEDLYRISPTGIENKENPGAGPEVLVGYIKQVRAALANTALSAVPIGHVDTWTAWANTSNVEVAKACDWVGVDAYPYFQSTMANSIENSKSLFDAAYGATQAAVNGKPVWVTETGFPVSGKTSNLAVPGLAAAKMYWDQVGCPLFGTVPTYWYTLQDSAPITPNPSFGIVGSPLSTTPLFDLSCHKVAVSSSSSSSTLLPTSSSRSAPVPTGSGSASSASASSASASSASASSTAPGVTSASIPLGGGSPGGMSSSQSSLQHSSASQPTTPSRASPTLGSSSGSGSSQSSSTTGSGESSSTTGTSTASAKPGTVAGAAEVVRGSLAGALVAGAFAVIAL